jgi:hypothetical protein
MAQAQVLGWRGQTVDRPDPSEPIDWPQSGPGAPALPGLRLAFAR